MMLVVMNQIIASNLGKFRPFILGVFKTLLTRLREPAENWLLFAMLQRLDQQLKQVSQMKYK